MKDRSSGRYYVLVTSGYQGCSRMCLFLLPYFKLSFERRFDDLAISSCNGILPEPESLRGQREGAPARMTLGLAITPGGTEEAGCYWTSIATRAEAYTKGEAASSLTTEW